MNMIPTVSVRHNRHDGNVAPHVTLGPSYIDRQPAPLAPRTVAQILLDRDAALAEREALEASRADLVLNGSAEDLLALDTRIALAKIKQDQAETQHAVAISAEAEARAEAEAEQVRRRALRKAGMKASAEVAKLADQYLAMATALADLLGRLREHERVIAEANQNLPEGAEPVPPGEPHNGNPGTPSYYETQYDVVRLNPDGSRAGVTSTPGKLVEKRIPKEVCIPATPSIPHTPLSGRPYLPGLGADASPIWGARHYINGETR
ncbi:hypothetical protein GOFOIKOB_5619 [Methylobacterium tardum]|uniref:Uncharacterized protein n=1 Tax=Methylobacterium tardum TaxID=374432 RepID=A0AA37T7B8_9HYPH|nr:hypothetical protein [Methylobacterium tardum]GJE52546.1 hypothetical protein GOFOIKOB_5619 [Methylobacterium tardum]GLS68076.1 hypothetical protein GCM10007890_00870 [Methylobacterium tardum]